MLTSEMDHCVDQCVNLADMLVALAMLPDQESLMLNEGQSQLC